MNTRATRRDPLDVVARVLIRCLAIALAILLFWFVAIVAADEWVYSIHSKMFELSKHEFDVMHYGGMGLLKLAAGTFFLVPYLAIRWAQRTL